MKIKLKVHANSSREKVEKISEKEYGIWIKEKPIEGKANKSIEILLKEYFGKNCKITSGFISNIKFVEVYD